MSRVMPRLVEEEVDCGVVLQLVEGCMSEVRIRRGKPPGWKRIEMSALISPLSIMFMISWAVL